MDCLSVLSIFLKHRVTKNVHTSIIHLCSLPFVWWSTNNNSPWKLFRPGLNLSNVSITMEINDSLHMLKDSISREISELTIVSKSWIDSPVCAGLKRKFHLLLINLASQYWVEFCHLLSIWPGNKNFITNQPKYSFSLIWNLLPFVCEYIHPLPIIIFYNESIEGT